MRSFWDKNHICHLFLEKNVWKAWTESAHFSVPKLLWSEWLIKHSKETRMVTCTVILHHTAVSYFSIVIQHCSIIPRRSSWLLSSSAPWMAAQTSIKASLQQHHECQWNSTPRSMFWMPKCQSIFNILNAQVSINILVIVFIMVKAKFLNNGLHWRWIWLWLAFARNGPNNVHCPIIILNINDNWRNNSLITEKAVFIWTVFMLHSNLFSKCQKIIEPFQHLFRINDLIP